MAVVVGLVLVLGLGGFFYLDRAAKKGPPAPPPLTGDARAYARNLKLTNVEMKAHESYLKQSVVEIVGNIQNVGDRIVKTVEINCVFYDAYGQVVLREAPALVVPAESIVIRDGRSYLLKLTDGSATPKVTLLPVTVGRRQGGEVEILQGIGKNDAVVVQGAGFLNDGDIVRLAR